MILHANQHSGAVGSQASALWQGLSPMDGEEKEARRADKAEEWIDEGRMIQVREMHGRPKERKARRQQAVRLILSKKRSKKPRHAQIRRGFPLSS